MESSGMKPSLNCNNFFSQARPRANWNSGITWMGSSFSVFTFSKVMSRSISGKKTILIAINGFEFSCPWDALHDHGVSSSWQRKVSRTARLLSMMFAWSAVNFHRSEPTAPPINSDANVALASQRIVSVTSGASRSDTDLSNRTSCNCVLVMTVVTIPMKWTVTVTPCAVSKNPSACAAGSKKQTMTWIGRSEPARNRFSLDRNVITPLVYPVVISCSSKHRIRRS